MYKDNNMLLTLIYNTVHFYSNVFLLDVYNIVFQLIEYIIYIRYRNNIKV